MADAIRWIEGGVCAPHGFLAGVAECGLKSSGRDLGLLVSPGGCTAAGVFTTNSLPGWPVVLNREYLSRSSRCLGVAVNSGVSNVATGQAGLAVAREMAEQAERRTLARHPSEARGILLAQTGIIGEVPDADKIRAGVEQAAEGLSPEGGDAFAEAIMTTDTRRKSRALEIATPAGTIRLGGCAKGAGMIAPRMATMLCFLTTDATLEGAQARALLFAAADVTLNRITVDGDTSTSDSAFLLASGAAGVAIEPGSEAERLFGEALTTLCRELALELIRDAEGVQHVARVEVVGAASDADALRAAKEIAESPLVKSALFGSDPNWGRIWCATGYSGAATDPNTITIRVGDVTVLDRGAPVAGAKERAREFMLRPEVEIVVDLGLGEGAAHYWFSDLTYDYVRINAEYHT